MRSGSGLGLLELVVVVALLGLGMAVALPAVSRLASGERAAGAARTLATTMQALRFRAVADGRNHGLRFSRDASGWSWTIVRDGNGNGLRSAEIAAGTDPTLSGPHRMRDHDRGVRLGFPPGGPVPRIPPASGAIDNLDDPIRFGRSELISFGPLGTSSSGTVYLTDGRESGFAVRIYGPTTRVRVWRFSRATRRWNL